MPKTKSYVTNLSQQHRLRTTIEFERTTVSHWAVQLELYSPDAQSWVWIARYDTAGGSAHRDRHLIAGHEAIALPEPASSAIAAAQQDLSKHASAYTDAYLEAKNLEGRGA